MVFCKEGNRALLQALKNLVQRDREAGEFVPPNFDSILRSLDAMSAEIDDLVFPDLSADIRTTYSPGREEFDILQAYNSLIKAGGRPICPLGETASISKHPRKHLELLGPWVKAPLVDLAIDWKGIFEKQLSNWQRFRAWQQFQQGIGGFSGCRCTRGIAERHQRGGKSPPIRQWLRLEVYKVSSTFSHGQKTAQSLRIY
ncbi:hypothetical protein J3458_009232 [Metarhizium acridum]|uniref:uncharacterized protein n=1 Tax=Metarhizium acridum TaxID=92637 RepID=UPI001C6BD986|nr:hypothetical protein J3458_009232 [Metarhizium acridum]